MRGHTTILVGMCSAAIVEMSGCATTCPSNIVSSVYVGVVDANGNPVTDAMVTYSVAGGPARPCVGSPGENMFICGREEIGDFLITVTRGSDTETCRLTIEEEGCHPDPQSITITLGA